MNEHYEELYYRVVRGEADSDDHYEIATSVFPWVYDRMKELEREKADRDERAMERDERSE